MYSYHPSLPSSFTGCINSALSPPSSSPSSSYSSVSLSGRNCDGNSAPSSTAHTHGPIFTSNLSPDTLLLLYLCCSLTTVLYHSHVTPFAARDALTIPAALFLDRNGYLCCMPPQRVDHKSLRQASSLVSYLRILEGRRNLDALHESLGLLFFGLFFF